MVLVCVNVLMASAYSADNVLGLLFVSVLSQPTVLYVW